MEVYLNIQQFNITMMFFCLKFSKSPKQKNGDDINIEKITKSLTSEMYRHYGNDMN